ncbi:glycosyltransferase family 2 protein [Roseicyclus sp.]|uniref:glycosyltransferase family 2 protein n=1 Tax=Roseicyclus sp. TaxID=1914329 RepID=UPI003F6C0013
MTKITSRDESDAQIRIAAVRAESPGPTAAEMVAIHASSRVGRSAPSQPTHPPLERLLLARGAAGLGDILDAREAASLTDGWIGQILLARGAVSEAEMLPALAEFHGLGVSDWWHGTPDPILARYLRADVALSFEAVPLHRVGTTVIIATGRPDRTDDVRAALRLPKGLQAVFLLAPRTQIIAAQIALYGEMLARLAEGQAPQASSCRNWRAEIAGRGALLTILTLAGLSVLFPVPMMIAAFLTAVFIFVANMALKIVAFAVTVRADRMKRHASPPKDDPIAAPRPLPIISILVPLFEEREIATTLMRALCDLDYPPERLDVLLIIEEGDAMTRSALSATTLPGWARIITVPKGEPRTKPRALNFALNFARGEIIGVYDAEDRPESDQLLRVAQRFAALGPDTACLQGQLDYFNARFNLLSRLFAIEYAIWFRVLLPGVQRLGLVVPLGGTTQFLRRAALEAVGGWDAHNVTEDAELGIRLARNGYRVEIIDTTTFEEANAAILPWVRQRARWQKGYLLTWAVAMRAPFALIRALGLWRFLALQVQILFAVAGFLIAPLLWSLMIKPFGYAHPLDLLVSPFGYGILATIFVASVVLSVALAIYATRAAHLRHLRPYVLLSELYFLLGTISAWRAALEILRRPFDWAKTRHGQFGALPEAAAEQPFSQTTSAPPP